MEKVTLATVLNKLNDQKRVDPSAFERPLPADRFQAALASIPLAVPSGWVQLLQLTNGFFGEIEAPGLERLWEHHQSHQEAAKYANPEFPDHVFHVAFDLSGDYVVLDLSRVTEDGDCPVMLFSHETMEKEREWESIGAFLVERFEENSFSDPAD